MSAGVELSSLGLQRLVRLSRAARGDAASGLRLGRGAFGKGEAV